MAGRYRSEGYYSSLMKQIEDMGSRRPGLVDVNALIEEAPYLKGLDVEERSDVLHALHRLRDMWYNKGSPSDGRSPGSSRESAVRTTKRLKPLPRS